MDKTLIDSFTGGKPIGVEVKIETKSLMLLAAVLVISAVAILAVRKLFI